MAQFISEARRCMSKRQTHLGRLFTWEALPPWIFVLWKPLITAIGAVSDYDTIKAHLVAIMSALRYALSVLNAPLGTVISFVLGFVWLRYLIVRGENAVGQPSATEPYAKDDPSKVADTLADSDAEHIGERIHWIQPCMVDGNPNLTGTEPYADFSLRVLNVSVLPIELQPKIDGRIQVDGQPLAAQLELLTTPSVLEHGQHQPIKFRQWLRAETAIKIRRRAETVFELGNVTIYFWFTHRGERRASRASIGNQLPWINPAPQGWQPFTRDEPAAISRAARLLTPKPKSVLIAWDEGADIIANEMNSIFSSAGWVTQIAHYDYDWYPQSKAGLIEVFGRDGDRVALDLHNFLSIALEYFIGDCTMNQPANYSHDVLIVIGAK